MKGSTYAKTCVGGSLVVYVDILKLSYRKIQSLMHSGIRANTIHIGYWRRWLRVNQPHNSCMGALGFYRRRQGWTHGDCSLLEGSLRNCFESGSLRWLTNHRFRGCPRCLIHNLCSLVGAWTSLHIMIVCSDSYQRHQCWDNILPGGETLWECRDVCPNSHMQTHRIVESGALWHAKRDSGSCSFRFRIWFECVIHKVA